MTVRLRDYQQRAVDQLRSAYLRGRRAPILVLPTGGGKSRCCAAIVELATARGNRSLLLAPRIEILEQLVAEVRGAGLPVRVIQAERDEGPADAPVTVASIWTLALERWRAQLPPADLVAIDECHRALAEQSYLEILRAYPAARLLGLTATPARADGRALGDVFDELVIAASVAELTAAGHLVPCQLLRPPSENGKLAHTVVEAYLRFVPDQLAIVFASGVKHARQLIADFAAVQIRAGLVTGTTPDEERAMTTRLFSAGAIRVLVNVACFVEGFDVPSCTAAILARKFGHVGPYLQAIGRVLRPAPGKTHATVIDLIGSALEHGPPDLPREYSLTGRGIRTSAVKDAIRQCASCGSISLAGPATCQYCGAAYPSRPRAVPKSDDRGLVDDATGEPAPKREYVVTMTSKRGGYCERCRGPFRSGEEILWWTVAKRAAHRYCRGERVSA